MQIREWEERTRRGEVQILRVGRKDKKEKKKEERRLQKGNRTKKRKGTKRRKRWRRKGIKGNNLGIKQRVR